MIFIYRQIWGRRCNHGVTRVLFNFPSGAYLANLVWIYMKRLLRNVVMDPSGLTSICYVARLLTLPQQHRDNACSYATLYIELPHLGSPVSDYP